MKGLILAGGSGTRLKPLTNTRSKQLQPIGNKPIIYYAIEALVNAGIKDIGIIISPETGEEIKKEVGNGDKWNIKITYIVQDKPLGLAHAVKAAREYLQDDDFIMYLGDNLIKYDLKDLVSRFEDKDCVTQYASILLKEVENPKQFGVANLDEFGEVIGLEEKPFNPKSNLALVGIYLFTKKIHKAIDNIQPSGRGELEITDAIQWLITNNYRVTSNIVKDYWLDTGKHNDMIGANRVVLDELIESPLDLERKKTLSDTSVNNKLEGRISLGADIQAMDTVIRGPVVIGNNCKLSNCYIGPFTSIGDGVELRNVEIENSIVQEGVDIINFYANIESSLIGRNSQLTKNKSRPVAYKLMLGDDSKVEVI